MGYRAKASQDQYGHGITATGRHALTNPISD